MPIVASDLIQPGGLVFRAWFPGVDLDSNLTLWIGQGAGLVPVGGTQEQIDAASQAYAYWRAFDAKLMTMADLPDSATLTGEGAATITQGRKYFEKKAAEWKAVFDAVLAATLGTAGESALSPPRASSTVPFAVMF